MQVALPAKLESRQGKAYPVGSHQTASEQFRLTKPGLLFGSKAISEAEARERLERQDSVTIERTVVVNYQQEKRLERTDKTLLKSGQELNDYIQRYGHDVLPGEIYQVEVAGKTGWVAPSQYGQAAFLDGDANFKITESEILAETTPSRLSWERDSLLDYQFHSLTQKIPAQVADYPSYQQAVERMDSLAQHHPERVSKVSIGKSREGREIWALKIGQGSDEALVTSLLHAREWATGQVALEMAQKLVQDQPKNLSVWVVPIANPDGYEITRTTDPSQRTNAAKVDLNRNFSTNWRIAGDLPGQTYDDKGGSDKVGDPTYRGPAPSSEPETQALEQLIQSRPNLKGWLDLHGYGRLLLYPQSGRPQAYAELTEEMQSEIPVPYKIANLESYGQVTGSALEHGERAGLLTVTMELGQSFQPAGLAREATVDEGVKAGMRFLSHLARKAEVL